MPRRGTREGDLFGLDGCTQGQLSATLGTMAKSTQSQDTAWADDAPLAGKEQLLPEAGGLVSALRGIGYSLQSAVADIVDNSIDAGATSIAIRLWGTDDELLGLDIADNGAGMTAEELRLALIFGKRRRYAPDDIGRFGMGLKSASLSQAGSLMVFTRRRGYVGARGWSNSDVEKNWQSHVGTSEHAARVLDQTWGPNLSTKKSGTVVRWSHVREFAQASGRVGAHVNSMMGILEWHLGLHFHRFLESRRLRIQLDFADAGSGLVGAPLTVAPRDPFAYPKTGAAGFPRLFDLDVNSARLSLEAHVWPDLPNHPAYAIGLTRGATNFQGFYFYTADRLIQAGGWNGLYSAEPHRSRSRVMIDLPRSAPGFELRYDKDGVTVPLSFLAAVKGAKSRRRPRQPVMSFEEYLELAVHIARTARDRAPRMDPIIPIQSGLPEHVSEILAEFPKKAGRGVSIRWAKMDISRAFELDRGRRVLTLNARLKNEIISADSIALLLFLALNDEFGRERVRAHRRRAVQLINDALVAASAEEH